MARRRTVHKFQFGKKGVHIMKIVSENVQNRRIGRGYRWLRSNQNKNLGVTSLLAACAVSMTGLIGLTAFTERALGDDAKPIKLCNRADEGVYASVAYEPTAGGPIMARGWWAIEADSCVDLNLPLGSDKLLVHGESFSHAHQWTGDQSLCVDGFNKFDFEDAATRPCESGDLTKRGFKVLSMAELINTAGATTPEFDFKTSDAVTLGDLLRICNDDSQNVYLSLAQKKADDSEFNVGGWFKIGPSKCYETVRLPGADELYIYANTQDDRKNWTGTVPLCTDDDEGYAFAEAASMGCDANNQRQRLFRKISLTGYTNFEYHLRPDDTTSPRSFVELCNKTSEKIYVSIAFKTLDISDQFMSTGWYNLEANSCSKSIPVNAESVFIRAEDENVQPLLEGAFEACVDLENGYEFSKALTMNCTGDSLGMAKFAEKILPEGLSTINIP
jgi:uncharacterized membrane protein